MNFAYADPPYLGCAKALYGDPTYDNPQAHKDLIERLCREFPDGWAMSCHTPSLKTLLAFCPDDVRIAAWVKPFCAFKVGVNPAYAWEPVIWRGGRKKRSRKVDTTRDYISEPIALRRGLPGAKPAAFALWIVDLLGAKVGEDTITDLFPGTGAMCGVWRSEYAPVLREISYTKREAQ